MIQFRFYQDVTSCCITVSAANDLKGRNYKVHQVMYPDKFTICDVFTVARCRLVFRHQTAICEKVYYQGCWLAQARIVVRL